MFYFEGPKIAQEKVDQITGNYSTLSAKLDDIFQSQSWNEFERKANEQFSKLLSEINNPTKGYCAVGPIARSEIDQLTQLPLPGFVFIGGSDSPTVTSCKDPQALKKVVDAYTKSFNNAMEHAPLRVTEKADERKSDLEESKENVQKNLADLDGIKQKLNKSVTFLFDTALFDNSLDTLQRAADDYGRIYDRAKEFANLDQKGVSKKTDVNSLVELESATEVFHVVGTQLWQPQTLLMAVWHCWPISFWCCSHPSAIELGTIVLLAFSTWIARYQGPIYLIFGCQSVRENKGLGEWKANIIIPTVARTENRYLNRRASRRPAI